MGTSGGHRMTAYGGRFRAPGGDQIRDMKGHYGSGFAINWIGLGAIVNDLEQYEKNAGRSLEGRMTSLARQVKEYAQKHAPWEDHTGKARDGLDTIVELKPNGEVSLVLFHTEEYGVYLENANGGAYSIIIPTMEHFAAEMPGRLFGPGALKP